MTNERLAELIPHIESALEDGYSLQLKGDDLRFLLEAIKARLSHEPLAVASFPYPTDRDGWICSVCHGWNGPKTRVCLHSHLQPELKSGGGP